MEDQGGGRIREAGQRILQLLTCISNTLLTCVAFSFHGNSGVNKGLSMFVKKMAIYKLFCVNIATTCMHHIQVSKAFANNLCM